jgi:hypothetical protein
MSKVNVKPKRLPPKRTMTKQEAIQHLIHAAARMIAAREDPFAIHLLIQSADKLLIDLAKRTGKKLVFNWGEFIKPEYKDAYIETLRETANFLKHADKDRSSELHVAEIAATNILQLGVCILNYHSLFDEMTDHMRLLFSIAKLFCPNGFVNPDERAQFDVHAAALDSITLTEFLSGWWTDPQLAKVFPNLASEKRKDLRDTSPLYDTSVSEIVRSD